jgi:hypothetical protein
LIEDEKKNTAQVEHMALNQVQVSEAAVASRED